MITNAENQWAELDGSMGISLLMTGSSGFRQSERKTRAADEKEQLAKWRRWRQVPSRSPQLLASLGRYLVQSDGGNRTREHSRRWIPAALLFSFFPSWHPAFVIGRHPSFPSSSVYLGAARNGGENDDGPLQSEYWWIIEDVRKHYKSENNNNNKGKIRQE